MIRPRENSPWHDYTLVFDDLRSSRLSMSEYEIMVDEDATEANRRRQELLEFQAICDEPSEKITEDFGEEDQKAEEITEDLGSTCACQDCRDFAGEPALDVFITTDPDEESITHAIDLVDDKAVILIRNEPSRAI